MKARDIKLVVVTGAGSGIGRATAIRFATDGATVICLDIDKRSAADTVALIEAQDGSGHAHKLDVTDAAAYGRLASLVKRRYGVPDVVVNNAGIVKIGATLTHTVEDWNRVLGVNLTGVIHGCRLFGAQMADRGTGGHLVNVASIAAYMPAVVGPSYCVSKAAVRMLSESLRAELASEGIGVSVICPGAVTTNLWGSVDYLSVGDHEADQRNSILRAAITVGQRIGLSYGPEGVATAIVRSVHHNWAVVPVRPESWAMYALSRTSPQLVRLGTRLSGEGTLDLLLGWATHGPIISDVIGRLVPRSGGSPPDRDPSPGAVNGHAPTDSAELSKG